MEYAQKVHEAEGDNITRLGYDADGFSIYGIARWVYPNGATLYTADNSAAAFDSPEGIAAGQFKEDLRQKHKFGPKPEGATFDNEQIVMDAQGSWSVGYIFGAMQSWNLTLRPSPRVPAEIRRAASRGRISGASSASHRIRNSPGIGLPG